VLLSIEWQCLRRICTYFSWRRLCKLWSVRCNIWGLYLLCLVPSVRCKEHLLPVMAIKNNSILGWYALSMHQSHQRLWKVSIWAILLCSRVMKGRIRRVMQELVKQTLYCMSFIVHWSQNVRFQTSQRCHFFISLCSYPCLWSCIWGNYR